MVQTPLLSPWAKRGSMPILAAALLASEPTACSSSEDIWIKLSAESGDDGPFCDAAL